MKLSRNKHVGLLLLTILTLSIAASAETLFVFSKDTPPPNMVEEEKISDEILQAIDALNLFRYQLKDPDSFKLYSDIVYYKFANDSVSYIYMDAGAENSFGGRERHNYCIVYYAQGESRTSPFAEIDVYVLDNATSWADEGYRYVNALHDESYIKDFITLERQTIIHLLGDY